MNIEDRRCLKKNMKKARLKNQALYQDGLVSTGNSSFPIQY